MIAAARTSFDLLPTPSGPRYRGNRAVRLVFETAGRPIEPLRILYKARELSRDEFTELLQLCGLEKSAIEQLVTA